MDGRTAWTTKLNGNGNYETITKTYYADGELHSHSTYFESADGRTILESYDYDGNRFADKTIETLIDSSGRSVATQKSFDAAGQEVATFVTTVSADGFEKTILRHGVTETITYSPTGNGSYEWDNGVTPSTHAYHDRVSHVVDALGFETWTLVRQGPGPAGSQYQAGTYEVRLDGEAKEQLIDEAARLYDTVLDRDMDASEIELLVLYTTDTRLDSAALVDALVTSDEYTTRYGDMSTAEFVTQTMLNAFGRAPSLEELNVALNSISTAADRETFILETSESVEHLVVGNGHRSTNNFDVIMNPAQFERSLDRAYVQHLVEKMVDVAFDRDATAHELDYLSELLLSGTSNLDDLAALLLNDRGEIQGVSSASLLDLSGTAFVNQAFLNGLGRMPTAQEATTWVQNLSSGAITSAQFVASLAQSIDHEMIGNVHRANSMPAVTVQTATTPGQSLTGDSFQDKLIGTTGAETLTGNAGSDILIGNRGDDLLIGNAGNDLYLWSLGDGNDTIIDANASLLATDILELTNVSSNEATFAKVGNDLRITTKYTPWSRQGDSPGKLTGETITVQQQFFSDTEGRGIEEILFADGVRVMIDEGPSTSAQFVGSAGNDRLSGWALDNTIHGFDGNDRLYGGSRNDMIYGGNGQDTLYGSEGNDFLDGGLGNDSIRGGAGADTIDGGEGDQDLLSYSTSGAGVRVHLAEQTATGGHAEGDVIRNIERIQGSNHSDRLFGDAAGNELAGGIGNDELHGKSGRDTLLGGNGKDSLFGGNGRDSLDGGAHNDSLRGGTSNDLLLGSSGEDSLYGDDGDDTLDGGAENDVLEGGAGNDKLSGDMGADTIDGGEGDRDLLDYAASNAGVRIDLGDGSASGGHAEGDIVSNIERIVGSNHNDRLIGDMIDNKLTGGNGDDELHGKSGRDTLLGGDGADSLFGGDGKDSLDGGNHNDSLRGGTSDDILIGSSGDDSLFGDDGVDTLSGGTGDDVLDGGAGDDRLSGERGADTIDGGDGDSDLLDYAVSNAGVQIDLSDGSASGGHAEGDVISNIEWILGSDHNDHLTGDGNRNELTGGGGDDQIDGAGGADTILGGTGDDTITDGAGFDRLFGGAGHDVILGSADTDGDWFYGGAGNDSIVAGGGNDTLWGDDGNDTLVGSAEADRLTGGAGADLFVFTGGSVVQDRIIDFTIGEDRMDVSAWGVAALADLTFSGSSTRIFVSDGQGNIVRLDGISITDAQANFTEADFIFAPPPDPAVAGTAGNDMIDGSYVDPTGAMINDSGQTITGAGGADTILGGTGDDTITDGAGFDRLFGGAGHDVILGSADTDGDWFYGGAGNDSIVAGGGNDTLWGDDGNDTLVGSAEADRLTGGAGADLFVFTGGSVVQDRIIDFTIGEDRMDVSAWGVAALADLTFSGSSTRIFVSDGQGNTVLLDGISITDAQANFTDADFIFA